MCIRWEMGWLNAKARRILIIDASMTPRSHTCLSALFSWKPQIYRGNKPVSSEPFSISAMILLPRKRLKWVIPNCQTEWVTRANPNQLMDCTWRMGVKYGSRGLDSSGRLFLTRFFCFSMFARYGKKTIGQSHLPHSSELNIYTAFYRRVMLLRKNESINQYEAVKYSYPG